MIAAFLKKKVEGKVKKLVESTWSIVIQLTVKPYVREVNLNTGEGERACRQFFGYFRMI
jgi:hypothetical protein